ncbi:hypothetical protein GCM10008018_15090 [Paenibacillus marchantiophytorum]|uniref:Uncharacterized protein n=1 Tax=Paenibacillus marchantiophytorum TaxID=1619310 RepID=A0ABQ2BRS1_9BACL|nr:hypothetical protein GCM10008018_15090 [Paenibacillus marchantiophytorum]
MNSDNVYCIQCNSIMVKASAEKIFKTGFYHTTIPLCLCKSCAFVQENTLSIEIISNSHKCYADFHLPQSYLVDGVTA